MMIAQRMSWGLWISGTILIILSWTGTVSPTVGWVGFGMALVGSLISWIPGRRPVEAPRRGAPGPASARIDDLAKLADLRERGAITEEEFYKQKKELLGDDREDESSRD